jgi:V8-like Glu-specific endopeptidase
MKWMLLVVALSAVLLRTAAIGAGDDISPVFQVVTYETAKVRLVFGGTGFFVDPDGTALTASHVVASAVAKPDTYGLLAIVGKELFNLSVVCATKVDKSSMQQALVTGDVARIRLAPFDKPFQAVGFTAPNGVPIELGHAHEGPMPTFPTLALSDTVPTKGDEVTVRGFGNISAIPYEWTSTGRVDEKIDQYHVFSIRSPSPPQPGNSGSPVLNTKGQVVGMMTWSVPEMDRTLTFAQTVFALKRPCP